MRARVARAGAFFVAGLPRVVTAREAVLEYAADFVPAEDFFVGARFLVEVLPELIPVLLILAMH
jgi:hypothetical protein